MPLAKPGGEAPSSRAQQALAAFVRQEFRSPVAAIIGYLDFLLADAHSNTLEGAVSDLQHMRLAATHLDEMVNRLVDRSGVDHREKGEDRGALHSRLRHDLRTPLNAIKGYGELLIEEARDGEHDAVLPDLERVLDLTNRLLGQFDRLLELAGISEDRRERVDEDSRLAAEIVDRVLATVKPIEADDAAERPLVSSRLLVVDDTAADRELLCRRLQREGHEVVAADTGERALELLGEGGFDLVLLDLMLPGMSGFEVLSQLKSGIHTRAIPVIMISALDEIDSAVRCIEAGAEDYLSKPFNPVVLRARVGACLERKRLHDRERAITTELRVEKERSEALLLQILPRRIVERMRTGEMLIADHIADATILFSDLVNFTALSRNLAPQETVKLLDLLFSRFDALAERAGLEKIKTIGDGYMIAGGVLEPRRDHAEAMAEIALAMHVAAADTSRALGMLSAPLRLRIGLHTGPLVAGVIGTQKFVYDVWGDTVNTASRMEKYGA
ncbi:MAG TPA: adenylate/guanylate cyclase domain-containing protein, partial [Stellaceae bacterium]|nr:adenylate/guanylate cyclase domain-containing protein [Stellaceae bacterium]